MGFGHAVQKDYVRVKRYGFKCYLNAGVLWSDIKARFTCCSVIRLHRTTTYVDVACCYRPSSVVCLTVWRRCR